MGTTNPASGSRAYRPPQQLGKIATHLCTHDCRVSPGTSSGFDPPSSTKLSMVEMEEILSQFKSRYCCQQLDALILSQPLCINRCRSTIVFKLEASVARFAHLQFRDRPDHRTGDPLQSWRSTAWPPAKSPAGLAEHASTRRWRPEHAYALLASLA